MDAAGHLNPMVAVTQEIQRSAAASTRIFTSECSAAAFRASGTAADLCFIESLPAGAEGSTVEGVSSLAAKSFLDAQDAAATAVRAVAPYRPDVIVHDAFDLRGPVIAGVLGVPRVALLPVAGLRALGTDFAPRHHRLSAAVLAANDRLVSRFDVDALGEIGCTPVLFPSSQLTLVTALPDQEPPADPAGGHRELDNLSRALGPALKWVGPCLRRDSASGSAPSAGRQLTSHDVTVLVALGTNIGTFRRGDPMGGLPSGQEFLRSVMELVIDAFDHRPDHRVIVSTGGWEPVRPLRWPVNFDVRPSVAQRQVLADQADVFITHHGLSSTAEAVDAQVPMLSFPGYGDQLANAEFCRRVGVTLGSWDLTRPSLSCSTAQLREATARAVDRNASSAVRRELRTLRRRMRAAGGARIAAALIVDAATGHGFPHNADQKARG